MKRVSRRLMISGGLALLAGSRLVACKGDKEPKPAVGAPPVLGERERAVVAHLRALMPYVKGEQAMTEFAKAFVAAGRELRMPRPDPDPIATAFLLSTDFFRQPLDPAREPRFVRLHSQFDACGNPFYRPA